MKQYKIEQLTFGDYGHTLHHSQVISPDNEWIVYDTRNEDSAIGTTTRIERVNLKSKKVEILYEVESFNNYGPGVGAATYSPKGDYVLFIHGLENASASNPYAVDRRTGVAIDVNFPNHPLHFDARNVIYPYTLGALRGGTHSHSWHPSGELISFTYNDEVLSKNGVANERTVGVMFPTEVKVGVEDQENFSGKMFSILIAPLVQNASPGSDEIEKAFDECWIGNTNLLAYQGWVRDESNQIKTEIFIAELDPSQLMDVEIGSESTYPSLSKAVVNKRVSCTLKGVSRFRHWLRSSFDGRFVFFLMEDDNNVTNIYALCLEDLSISKVTNHISSIHSPFNVSKDGSRFIYFCEDSLFIFNHVSGDYTRLIADDKDLYGIPNFDQNDEIILFNRYVVDEATSKNLQIFKISI